MKKEQEEAIQKILEAIDTISTQEEYMQMCFKLCSTSMDSIFSGNAPIESMSMLRIMLMYASQKDISYRSASRKSADSLHHIFKGIIELEKRFDSGEDVSEAEIAEAAMKSVMGVSKNV